VRAGVVECEDRKGDCCQVGSIRQKRTHHFRRGNGGERGLRNGVHLHVLGHVVQQRVEGQPLVEEAAVWVCGGGVACAYRLRNGSSDRD